MHHPVSFDPFGSSTFVENEWFLQSYALVSFGGVNGSVRSGGFPESSSGDSVGSCTVSILPVSRTVEIPLLLPSGRQFYIWLYIIESPLINNDYVTVAVIKWTYLEDPMGRICKYWAVWWVLSKEVSAEPSSSDKIQPTPRRSDGIWNQVISPRLFSPNHFSPPSSLNPKYLISYRPQLSSSSCDPDCSIDRIIKP